MIYGFTRQSGGHVRIDSEVGVGTTMALYLPRFTGVLAQDDMAPADAPLQRNAAHSRTVLLVEDETAIRVLISEVLTEAGYRVIETAEGSAAVERLRSQEHIDVLVTDVIRPAASTGVRLPMPGGNRVLHCRCCSSPAMRPVPQWARASSTMAWRC